MIPSWSGSPGGQAGTPCSLLLMSALRTAPEFLTFPQPVSVAGARMIPVASPACTPHTFTECLLEVSACWLGSVPQERFLGV